MPSCSGIDHLHFGCRSLSHSPGQRATLLLHLLLPVFLVSSSFFSLFILLLFILLFTLLLFTFVLIFCLSWLFWLFLFSSSVSLLLASSLAAAGLFVINVLIFAGTPLSLKSLGPSQTNFFCQALVQEGTLPLFVSNSLKVVDVIPSCLN